MSMMKTSFKIVEPEKLEININMTLTLAQWKIIKASIDLGLKEKFHVVASEFRAVLREVIEKAENEYTGTHEISDP